MNRCEEKTFGGLENDVQLYYCGKREYNYSHFFGPYDRDSFLLYYIKEGKARLQVNGREQELYGEGFFVNFPHSQATYHCIKNVPWSIKWVAIGGSMVERYLERLGITREAPFLPLQNGKKIEAVLNELYTLFDRETLADKMYCIALVYKLFSLLLEGQQPITKEQDYVRSAWRMIEGQFADATLNVTRLACGVGLNANYFSILFKRETGISPVKALSEYRLEMACKMLKFTNQSVKDVAHGCGFLDELYFSRVFKKRYGISPIHYRNKEEYCT